MDAVNEMMQDDQVDVQNGGRGAETRTEQFHIDNNFFEEQEGNSYAHSAKTAQMSESRGKKRNATDNQPVDIYEMLTKLCKYADERLEKLAEHIGYDFKLGNAKKRIFDELRTILALTMHQRFDVCEMLAEKTECLEIFMGLPEDARSEYVACLLGSPPN